MTKFVYDTPEYYELDLVGQIIWHPKKKELTPFQQFRIQTIAAVADYVRSKPAIDLMNVTVEELIEYAKTIP